MKSDFSNGIRDNIKVLRHCERSPRLDRSDHVSALKLNFNAETRVAVKVSIGCRANWGGANQKDDPEVREAPASDASFNDETQFQ